MYHKEGRTLRILILSDKATEALKWNLERIRAKESKLWYTFEPELLEEILSTIGE